VSDSDEYGIWMVTEPSRRRHAIRKTSRRDRVAQLLCNWVLNHVATAWYRDMVAGSIRYGLEAAVKDEDRKGREPV
jgi:hypothetical protein